MELTLRIGIEEVYFSLNQCLKQHDVEQAHCMKTNSVNSVCKKMDNDLMIKNSFDEDFSSILMRMISRLKSTFITCMTCALVMI